MKTLRQLPISQPLSLHRPSAWHADRAALLPLARVTDLESRPVVGPLPGDLLRGSVRRPVPALPTLASSVASPSMPRQLAMLPKPQRFPITVDFSREEVRLPFGVPRFVNTATLKRMAGGSRFDQLLKKVGTTWEFVADEVMVDLTNQREQYRVGRITILS
jgi:hypothetical protein